jgi:putative ABC transport system substrate-binding protein
MASPRDSAGMRRVLLTLLAALLPLSGGEALVVLSADKPPYREAEKGLSGAIATAGDTMRTVLLDDLVKRSAMVADDALVVAIGTPAAVWLHEHARRSRVIFCLVADPSGAGLVDAPIIGGVPTDIPLADQLSLIGEALPKARTLGMLYRSDQERSALLVATLRQVLPVGWTLEAVAIDRQESPAVAIDVLLGKAVDVVWTTPDNSIFGEATVRTLLLTALRRRIPVFGFSPAFVRAGGLVGIGVNPETLGAQAGALLLRLQGTATGAQPPVQLAPTFEICVNLVVAQKLSIDLPPALVKRATHVYQAGP